MAKKEVNTDLWVHELLKEAGIRDKFDAQGSNIKELNDALKTASKKGTGKSGFPEYVGIVKDFLIVITLNKNTFYGVGTNPCIAVFTAGIPHRPEKECKFINFENDGFEVSKHIGLVETATAKDKKQHLLDVWFDRTEAETKFCVQTTIEADDEWLHSFYYFNDEIPSEEDFQKTIADYLTFEVNMITHGRGYLFGIEEKENYQEITDIEELPMVAEKGDDYE